MDYLYDLARNGRFNKLKKQVRDGWGIDGEDMNGDRAIHGAVLYAIFDDYQKGRKMLTYLVNNLANIDAQGWGYKTPMDHAKEYNDEEVINLLIKLGADY